MREEKKNPNRIDYEKYTLTTGQFLKFSCVGSALGCFAIWICYHSFFAVPLAVFIAGIYLYAKRKECRDSRKRMLHYHFKDFLAALHTDMMAGYSLENGVKAATADLVRLYGEDDVLCRELIHMTEQMEYQIPVEQMFRDLGKRSHVEDIQSFSEVLVIAKRTGGNMGHILQSTWNNMSEKIETGKEIDAMIASRKYELMIMSCMPAGIVLYMRLTFSGFMEKLYGNTVGVIFMTICLLLYGAAFLLGRKLTQIDV